MTTLISHLKKELTSSSSSISSVINKNKLDEGEEASEKPLDEKIDLQNIVKSYLGISKDNNKDLNNMTKKIFPPDDFEYQELEDITNNDQITDNDDIEDQVQSLLQKYSKGDGKSPKYKIQGEQLENCLGYGQNKILGKELKQAMEDITKITTEIEESKDESTKAYNQDLEFVQDSEEEISKMPDEGSPLLDMTTKEKLMNLGQSMDSKKLTEAMGFIDLRMLLKCYSKALAKHIEFSKGYLFMSDKLSSATMQKEGLHFTYDLKSMKINLKKIKENISLKAKGKEECKAFELPKRDVKNLANLNITIQDSELLDTLAREEDHEDESFDKTSEPSVRVLNKASSEAVKKLNNADALNATNESSAKMKDSFLSSFLTANEGRGTMQSATSSAFDSSLQYSNTAITYANATKKAPMEIIHSVEGDSNSNSEKEKDILSDDQDDIDRYEEIDVKNVQIDSSDSPIKKKKQKSILSPEQIAQVHKERELESSEEENIQTLMQCKELIETGHFTIDDFKKDEDNKEFSEGYKFLNAMTERGLKDNLETQLLKCHQNYNFDTESMVDLSVPNSSVALKEFYSEECPTQDEIYYYAKYIVLSSRMEKEIPLVSLAYLERLCSKTGILINHWNWRRLMLISLTVASKIWDDESLENIHFPKAMPDVSLKEINNLEKLFLDLLGYDLMVRGADYAKYYFILRSISKEFEDPEKIQMDPITVENMQLLQKNSDRAEDVLREIYKSNDFSASL